MLKIHGKTLWFGGGCGGLRVAGRRWEVNPRASIILETIRQFQLSAFKVTVLQSWRRPSWKTFSFVSQLKPKLNSHLNHPTPQLDYCSHYFPTGRKLNSHVSDSFIPNSSQWYIERAIWSVQKNSIPSFIFLFCLLNPHFPHCVDMDSSFGQL